MAVDNKKPATVIQIGGFNADGTPDGNWKFDRPVRLIKKSDGTYTYGGWTNDQLLAKVEAKRWAEMPGNESGGIAGDPPETKKAESAPEKEAPEAAAKSDIKITVPGAEQDVKAPEGAPTTPSKPASACPVKSSGRKARTFEFDAVLTGVSAKKPPKLGVRKELKLLSPDMETLKDIDGFLERDVKVRVLIGSWQDTFDGFDDQEAEDRVIGEEPGTTEAKRDDTVTGDVSEIKDAEQNAPDNTTVLTADELGQLAEQHEAKAQESQETGGQAALDLDGGTTTGTEQPAMSEEPTDLTGQSMESGASDELLSPYVCGSCEGATKHIDGDPAHLVCIVCGMELENPDYEEGEGAGTTPVGEF